MEQRVETLASRWVTEDDLRQPDAVERGVAYGLRPDSGDFHETVAVWSDHLARDRIGVDDKGPEAREYPRNRTLPCADAAGQANAQGGNLPFLRRLHRRFRQRLDPDLFLDGVLLDLF